ncbi:hypothetical protein L3X38_012708 [Prunus dulcis]|uniref:Disease resistance protein winged helix domain-containing protein n=1 Tax=Prunus dulcis TaxID=3755 RepID=A0AAD4WKK1_PRUDU|nr:hypothetical protein L3X38_012708 [Prunus dulcis]
MAEGFISLTSMEVMEDVSYMCLSELVDRCMVQVGKHGSSKKIKTCHLHDLMRDLCMLKAKEENFLHIINYSAAVNIKQTPNSRVRRAKLPGEIENLVHLRFLSLKNSLIEAVPSSIANLMKIRNKMGKLEGKKSWG